MSHARVPGILGVTALAAVAVTAAAVAYAQTTVTPIPDKAPVQTAPLDDVTMQTTWGDPEKGAVIAGTCAACHGLDGNPTDPQYPRLAGQSERYIAQQIALYKSGERSGPLAAVMVPYANMLSPQEARDVGAYFSMQDAGAGVADDTVISQGPYKGMAYFEVGEQLYLGGDASRDIPACMACHGPAGAGNPGPAYPHLAGQQAAYVQRRLEMFRAGETSRSDTALFDVMASVAQNLTDLEIGALATYLQGLHPSAEDLAVADAPAPLVTGAAPAMAPSAASTTTAAPATTAASATSDTAEADATTAPEVSPADAAPTAEPTTTEPAEPETNEPEPSEPASEG